jgi:hypothetical protein
VIFYAVEQNSLEWYQLRLGIPTASEFERIMTPAKRQYSSQAEGYMRRLIEEWWTGEQTESEQYQAPWMERGQQLEDRAVMAYEDFELPFGEHTSPGGFVTTDDGLIGCSPDRLVGADGILEIKCPLLGTQLHNVISQGWEKEHITQIQGQLWVTGRQWVDLYSFHPRCRLPQGSRRVRVHRDEEFIAALETNVRLFIQDMLQRREQIIASGNPPERPEPAEPLVMPDGLSEEDVEAHLANLRRQRAS